MNTMPRKTNKERHLSVRITGPDLAALERAAAASRLSVATYVRQQALWFKAKLTLSTARAWGLAVSSTVLAFVVSLLAIGTIVLAVDGMAG